MQVVQLISKTQIGSFFHRKWLVLGEKKNQAEKKVIHLQVVHLIFSMNTQIGSLLTKNGWFQLSSQTPSP